MRSRQATIRARRMDASSGREKEPVVSIIVAWVLGVDGGQADGVVRCGRRAEARMFRDSWGGVLVRGPERGRC